jgi:hypothetical protein
MSNTSVSNEIVERMRAEEEAEKKRAAEEQGRRGVFKTMLKFPAGTTVTVRILPSVDPNQFPYVTGNVHYGIKPPRPCPGASCDLCAVLKDWEASRDPDKQPYVKALKAKKRAYYKVLDRADGHNIHFMNHSSNFMGTGVHDQIRALFTDPEASAPPADVYNGVDIDISYKGGPNYLVKERKKATPLADTKEKIDAILKEAALLDLNACIAISEEDIAALSLAAREAKAGTLQVDLRGADAPPLAGAGAGSSKAPALTKPPACFGNPDYYNPDNQTCQVCTYNDQCYHKISGLGIDVKPVQPPTPPNPTPPTEAPGGSNRPGQSPDLEALKRQHAAMKSKGA